MQDTGVRWKDKLPHVGTTIFTVMSRLAAEAGAINLSQGFPDFPMDQRLISLVAEAMRAGHNQYAPMPGLPVLAEAIAQKVQRVHGHLPDPGREITITAGGTQAIFTALAAIVHQGDEVIIIDPAYDCYAPTVELFGGRPVHVSMDLEMRVELDALANAITARTRAIMINSPHNPGGRILRHEDMLALERMLLGSDIILISDEVYEHIIFDGEEHASVLRYPALRDRAFVIFSFGKTFHGTGWKVGYVIAPDPLMPAFRKVHQFNVFSVNTPVQHALAAYMQDPGTYEGLSVYYQGKRDHFAKGLQCSRFRVLPCEGSYFQLLDYSAISEEDDVSFAQRLVREHGVASIPLSPFFSVPPKGLRLLRFCFAKHERTLDNAIERLCAI